MSAPGISLCGTQIDPEVAKACKEIALAGKYDDAIFSAFRLVEGTIQERLSSGSIGDALIAEAFDGTPPKILISTDSRDQRGIRGLFSGALSNIRNDRGHKKSPLTPCESLEACLLYLGFASFLLYLLGKDKALYPRVDSVRILGTADEPRAELRGLNLMGAQISVTAKDTPATIVRKEPSTLEVLLPLGFYGDVLVDVDGKKGRSVFCDASALGKQPENYYEVIAAEVLLYSDSDAKSKREGVVGLLLRSNEGGREFIRIVPTYSRRYESGQYVTHGPYEFGSSVPETWYVDPATGKVEYAWTGSMIMVPEVIGRLEGFKLGGISILPRGVETQLGENRCLRVLGWGRDGKIQKELDVTERVKWKSADSAIAFIDSGRLISKKLGRTRVECELDGFMASIEISVEHIIRGQRQHIFRVCGDCSKFGSTATTTCISVTKARPFTGSIRLVRSPKSSGCQRIRKLRRVLTP